MLFCPFFPYPTLFFFFCCLLGFCTSTVLSAFSFINCCVTLCCGVQLSEIHSPICTAPLPDLGSSLLRKFLFTCEKAGELKLGKISKVKTDGSATVEAAIVNSSRTQREKY